MEEKETGHDYYDGWPDEMKQDHEMFYNLFNPEMEASVIEDLERGRLREIKTVMDDLVSALTLDQKQKLNNLLSWVSSVMFESRMFTEDMAFKAGWHFARGDLSSIKILRDNRVSDYNARAGENVSAFIDHKVGGSYVDAYLYSDIGYFMDEENPGGVPDETGVHAV